MSLQCKKMDKILTPHFTEMSLSDAYCPNGHHHLPSRGGGATFMAKVSTFLNFLSTIHDLSLCTKHWELTFRIWALPCKNNDIPHSTQLNGVQIITTEL